MDSGCGHSGDRISNLPDEVLCHILSFLPTKYAVGTSILSTRWRYLWVSIHNLDFDEGLLLHRGRDDYNYLEKYPHFVNFVNRVLLLSDVSYIQKFHLRLWRYCNLAIVHTWICFAIERNVQDLCLNVGYDVNVPRMLFTSKTLVILQLTSLIPELPIPVWLPSLKILRLRSVIVSEANSAQELFIGCPILEELDIVRGQWDYQWDFNVSSPSLKRLTIEFLAEELGTNEYRDYECKLVVDAPNLEYLRIFDLGSEDYSMNNLTSLFKAHINVLRVMKGFIGYIEYGDRIYKLLRGISNVKFLSLSDDTLYALRHAEDSSTLPTFHNLTHLELTVGEFGWNLLTDFLKSSPNLEVLVLGERVFCIDLEEHWRPPKRVPNCLVSHLKEIEIREIYGAEYELDGIEYMLENAKVLKKMAIYRCYTNSEEEKSSVREKLSRFPRGSRSCQLSLRF